MGHRFCLMIAMGFAGLCVSPLAAQSGWLLPTDVQSKIEQTAPAPSATWILPNPLATQTTVSGAPQIVPVKRPEQTLFSLGTVVATGFSGTYPRKPVWRKDQPEPDRSDIAYRFIDPNGVSAQLISSSDIGFAMNGAEVTRQAYDKLLARDIGQVFGIAIDNARFRNLYLTASSAYGLNIIGPDDNGDSVPERLFIGSQSAEWMPAQWGSAQGAGPGSVWKVDGKTGQISLFANVTYEDRPNAGASLGNIAFDALHDQLFVSDLQTGMIHRYALDGTEQQVFDHGATQDVPFEALPDLGITTPDFDVEDPGTWGFAPEERRIWGLAVQGGRLYYATAEGPVVWSVGIDRKTGGVQDDVRKEITLPREYSRAEVSDMAFAGDGALILGQRGPLLGAFDFTELTRKRRGAVLRYVRIKDAQTGEEVWTDDPALYPVGFHKDAMQGAGGVATGPHYDVHGAWDTGFCAATLWTTGGALRENAGLERALGRGGATRIDGLQAQSVALPENGNQPPWKSYFFDRDGLYPEDRTGHMGDVEAVGCRGAGGLAEHYANTSWDETGGTDDTDTETCAQAPWLCVPSDPPACMTVQAAAVCNPQTGEYELRGLALDSDGHGLDRLKISDPAAAMTGFPADVSMPGILQAKLTGWSAGQIAQLNLCAYESTRAATGAPYPCCNATVDVTVPDAACEKEEN